MNAADVVDVAGSYAMRGYIAALRGDHEQGIELAQRGVEIAERTDFFEVRANMYIELGHVLAFAGRREEAAAAYERALAAARDKGATAWEAQIEALLAKL
jgi:tetratricopeptide (TPR) repeat protein